MIKTKVLIVLSSLLFLVLFITQADPFLRSDSFYYFHTAKSIVDSGNFVTDTKPIYWDVASSWTQTVFNNKFVSVASPGTAILSVPALLIAKGLKSFIDINNQYYIEYNGHTLIEGVLILLNTTLFFFLSLYLIYRTLIKLGVSKKISVVSIILVSLSTFVLWYVMLLPLFTHVFEIFFISLLLFSIVSFDLNKKRKFLILITISLGFLFLIRPIFLLIAIFTIGYLVWKHKSFSKRNVIILFSFAVPFLLVYLLYNYVSYGNPLTSGYAITRGETFNFSSFNGFNILFSQDRGWLIYSPIVLFCIAGLLLNLKKNFKLYLFSLGVTFSLVFVYGFWPSWWGGGSFGARFMLYTFPFCVLGLALLLQYFKNSKYKKFIYSAVLVSALYSFTLMLLFRVTPTEREFNTPIYYFNYQLELLNKSNNIMEFLSSNVQNIQLGSGFLAIAFDRMDYFVKPSVKENLITFELVYPPTNVQLKEDAHSYLVDKFNKKAYLIKFKNLNSFSGSIDCTKACESTTLEIVETNTKSVLIKDYIGLILNDRFEFYLKSGKNIQPRGIQKTWLAGDTEFKFL